MSDIQVKCVDQTLTITNSPLIASGGVLEDRVVFDFCPLWTDYTKTAVFYRDKDNIYPVELADDTCYIPHDVLREKGKIYFGVYGTAPSDNSETAYVRTSEVLSYEIAQGIFAATNVPDPTPNIYEQLFEKLGILNNVLTEIETAQQAAQQAATTAQTAAESALETLTQTEENAETAQQAAQNAQTAATNAGTAATNAAANAVNTHNADKTAHSDIREEINTHTEDTNIHVTAAEKQSWNNKLDALTFDDTPTENSTNPVTSGGIKTALDLKQDKSTAITTSNIGNQTVNKAKYATDDVAVGTPALRNQYFVSAEATPTVNGQIAWVYG